MFGKYFCGNEISRYGQEHGYVDYRTFSKAFDAVLNNDIMQQTQAAGLGYWEPCGASEEYYEDGDGNRYTYAEAQSKIEEINEELATCENEERIEELEAERDALEEEHYYDVFQWYIIDDNGARICEEFGEIVYYNEALDMYLWGVTHYGTSWDYVLTDIPCNASKE